MLKTMILVVLLVILCAVFAVWSWMRPRLPGPPIFPGAIPLIGHSYQMAGNAADMWKIEKKMYNYCLNNGGVLKILLGYHPIYVLTDPDDALQVSNTCFDKPYVYNFGKEMYDRGLVVANELTWKPHRKLLSPAFNQQALQTYVDVFSAQAKCLVSQLAPQVGKGPFDVHHYLINNIVVTTCRTLLGLHTDDQSDLIKNYVHATEGLFDVYRNRLYKIWLHLPCIFNMSYQKKKQDQLMKILKDITKSIIFSRKAELEAFDVNASSTDKFRPLLDQMLDLADKRDAFTDEEIREHIDTFITAAYDTTAASITFALLLIGSHEDIQDKIYQELQKVLGHENRDMNRTDLPKLAYLEAVIKESIRLYPAVPRIARSSECEVKLKNYTLPANCYYLVSVYGINRHPMWGADADQFKPERWLNPSTLPANPNTYASFSIGRRNCIGKLYGIMLIKTTLAQILRQYHVTGNINDVQLQCDIICKPINGHLISLDLRK